MSTQDKSIKEYKLNVDPRILELLGPNLYTNIYYVLAELIANSYDADAKNVYIIDNEESIRIEDDGHGMSYNAGEIDSYLNVAATSRHNEQDSFTREGTRRKMGRKGVGKLAALSVSENVDILTVVNDEKSGFVLSRRPETGNRLEPIPDKNVAFKYIKNQGTAIVMHKPEYSLHKTFRAIERNLLKIFPMVDSKFRIHIVRGKKTHVISDFDKSIMKELCTLTTLGTHFSSLAKLVPETYKDERSKLVETGGKEPMPYKKE